MQQRTLFNKRHVLFLFQRKVIAKSMIEQSKGGAIVMMSSILSSVAFESNSVYCCSKAALDQLTRCLALELGSYKV